jgi:hypothetical protein
VSTKRRCVEKNLAKTIVFPLGENEPIAIVNVTLEAGLGLPRKALARCREQCDGEKDNGGPHERVQPFTF